MKSVMIVSTRTDAGKTTIGYGLGSRWAKKGKTIGYFKPWGDRLNQKRERVFDQDSVLFKRCFDIPFPIEKFTPAHDYETMLQIYEQNSVSLRDKITESFEELSRDRDLLIVEGPRNYSFGGFLDLSSGEIATMIGSKAIIVANGDLGVVADKTLSCNRILKSLDVDVLGVVINGAADPQEVNRSIVPPLQEREIKVLGIVPHNSQIAALTPRVIAEELGAKILAGEGGLDHPVEHTSVGAMTVARALGPMRKARKIALITGGDRTDMQLAAFEVSTTCLILTGGLYPDQTVLSKADEREIPVLLVSDYTYNTAKKVEHITPLLRYQDGQKRTEVEQLVNKHVSSGRVLDEL